METHAEWINLRTLPKCPWGGETGGSEVRTMRTTWTKRHRSFTLKVLLCRIGMLGPEPGGLAVWTIPRFAALSEIAVELDGVCEPIELQAAGTYSDVGREII